MIDQKHHIPFSLKGKRHEIKKNVLQGVTIFDLDKDYDLIQKIYSKTADISENKLQSISANQDQRSRLFKILQKVHLLGREVSIN